MYWQFPAECKKINLPSCSMLRIYAYNLYLELFIISVELYCVIYHFNARSYKTYDDSVSLLNKYLLRRFNRFYVLLCELVCDGIYSI